MQNLLTDSLKAISKSDFFTEKILICPSFGTGNQILESFLKAQNSWINFKANTIRALAVDLAQEEICKRGLKIISMTETVFLIDRIFTQSAQLGELKYFEKHTINTGIIRAIASSLMELKFAGIGHLQVKDKCFIDNKKAQDLRHIYAKYEAGLKELSLIDIADIIVLATGIMSQASIKKKYIVLARHEYQKIEQDFLTSLCTDSLIVIGQEKVFNLAMPKNRLMATDIPGINGSSAGNFGINTHYSATAALEPCPEAHDAATAANDYADTTIHDSGAPALDFTATTSTTKLKPALRADIELFCAQNYRDEIYAILSRLAGAKNAVDDTEIIYTSSEPYIEVIHSTCQKLNISVTFSAGLPGEKSDCGKALKGFLLWIKEDFLEVYLRNLFKYGLLKISLDGDENDPDDTFGSGETDAPTLESNSDNPDSDFKTDGFVFAHALRLSNIGWGRKRYIAVLEKSITDIKTKLKDGKNKQKYYQGRILLFESLKKYVSKLLDIIPEIKQGKVDFKLFCNCCEVFLSNFVYVKDETEARFLSNLKQSLKTLELVVANEVSVEEAVQKLILLIKDARFLSSGPKPGSLFVSNLSGGGLSGRGNIFIVGMDDHKFPGTEMQDSVLLDYEREKTSSRLSLSKVKMKEKLYDFWAMLAAIRGKVNLSFSVFDMKDERNLSASSALLQIYRLKTTKADADYSELLKYLGRPAGYGQDSKDCPPVDESYWWLDKLLSGERLKDSGNLILNIYPDLCSGVKAEKCRNSNKLTCFDGLISSEIGSSVKKTDPRNNSSFILSCTGIEMYARSPFEFFLTYILKVKRPEEIKKDMSLWLDGKNKGSLLHDVYQDFTDRMISIGYSTQRYPDTEEQRKIIKGILNSVIEKYIEKIPVPGEAVFKREVTQLKIDTDIFLNVNEKLGNPYLAEYEFGYNDKEPVKINVGPSLIVNDSGQKDLNAKSSKEESSDKKAIYIYLKGRIDRVDFDLDKTSQYHVWDYKTGSSHRYEEDGFIGKGKQLQHVLYAKVIEEFLKSKDPDARVTKCGYIFPTQKGRDSGKSCILERDPHQEHLWKEALGCILDLISAGVFIISDEENPPYLEDDDIYGSQADKKNIKAKINNPENKILEKWKLLKKFN